ncbi:hypothetical protein H6P81_009453 [Aristolochia fimbriata]|uniref:KIB1-4 beta-propeller domain-containing protein n=1 Tax=Aristolochia fimbriata TaxID=158543 RepID=A0AAV7EL37_ARIFI|nr:hypothetical protein H6P81_009453 [Aristolochia fimbriata]
MDASSSFLCETAAIREQASRQSLAETVPEDVLALVFRRLNNLNHFLSFGAVCRRLHGISTKHKTEFMTKLFPLLVIEDYLGYIGIFFGFPNHSTRTFHRFVKVRDIDPKFECYGSSHGWLIVGERERRGRRWNTTLGKRKMRLLNPVSGQQLSLPDFSWPDVEKVYPHGCKFVLSSNPSSSSSTTGTTCFVAAAAFSLHPEAMGYDFPLAFAPVDRDAHEWTRIKHDRFCEDIIFFKDKLYGIGAPFGTILCVEDIDEAIAAGRSGTGVTEILSLGWNDQNSPLNPYNFGSYHHYLAESQGNLLAIQTAMRWVRNQGTLHIYKLILDYVDDSTNGSSTSTTKPAATWSFTQVYSLNDQVLFIGINSSISIPVSSSNSSLKNCVLSVVDRKGVSIRKIGVNSLEEPITIPDIPSRPMFWHTPTI